MDNISKELGLSDTDIKKLKYKLEVIKRGLPLNILFFIFMLYFYNIGIWLYFMINVSLYRKYFGGIHFRNNLVCIVSSILYIAIILVTNAILDKSMVFYILLISILLFYLYSPKGTYLYPLGVKQSKKYRKIGIYLMLLNILLYFFINNAIVNLGIIICFYSLILTTPLIYKLFDIKEKRE